MLTRKLRYGAGLESQIKSVPLPAWFIAYLRGQG